MDTPGMISLLFVVNAYGRRAPPAGKNPVRHAVRDPFHNLQAHALALRVYATCWICSVSHHNGAPGTEKTRRWIRDGAETPTFGEAKVSAELRLRERRHAFWPAGSEP